jgi:hypothetical protein
MGLPLDSLDCLLCHRNLRAGSGHEAGEAEGDGRPRQEVEQEAGRVGGGTEAAATAAAGTEDSGGIRTHDP